MHCGRRAPRQPRGVVFRSIRGREETLRVDHDASPAGPVRASCEERSGSAASSRSGTTQKHAGRVPQSGHASPLTALSVQRILIAGGTARRTGGASCQRVVTHGRRCVLPAKCEGSLHPASDLNDVTPGLAPCTKIGVRPRHASVEAARPRYRHRNRRSKSIANGMPTGAEGNASPPVPARLRP